jgi:hypothetical protein
MTSSPLSRSQLGVTENPSEQQKAPHAYVAALSPDKLVEKGAVHCKAKPLKRPLP